MIEKYIISNTLFIPRTYYFPFLNLPSTSIFFLKLHIILIIRAKTTEPSVVTISTYQKIFYFVKSLKKEVALGRT